MRGGEWITYERAVLYEQVWAQPVRTVSSRQRSRPPSATNDAWLQDGCEG